MKITRASLINRYCWSETDNSLNGIVVWESGLIELDGKRGFSISDAEVRIAGGIVINFPLKKYT